ncbi:hypothetical protein HNW77_01415 [Komagataeibacter sp. AV436]|uniref:Uncharacterized protein n=1 Tax=Komagataeibacter melomenusus TaxID=2766578 RepID=A0ABX2A9I3_9PROT|nr:hypothetical protein [Komagataeibacter melomenusus]MBV1829715.1 hypothetical protein [Komagataeibacter melomenusus]NPC65084.1 hypothetical protein [Komagataeibacter melomenusus]
MSVIKKGIVRSGEYNGWKVEVDFDEGDTKGYYIYIIKSPAEGYDAWCKDMEGVNDELEKWNVAWE